MKHQTDRNRPRSGRHALTLRRAVWTHPHELRHTAASLAVAAGANVKAVQQMLGHASAAMTLDVYAGLFADDLDGVADRLSSLHEIECGPNGTARCPGQSNQGVLPFENRPNKPLVRANGIRAALENRTPDYALRASPVVHGRNGWCEMPLATARLAMTRRGRIVACGDKLGTPQYQPGDTPGRSTGHAGTVFLIAVDRRSGHAVTNDAAG
jgi:hypothetical protein